MGRHRRGNATLGGVSLLAVMAIAALTVDLGSARAGKAQLQASTDAIAHAATGYLDGTEAGLLDATAGAKRLASLNRVFGYTIELETVQTGIWDHDSGTFTASSDAEQVNAVRVATRTDLPTFFAGVVMEDGDLEAGAAAISALPLARSAASVDCYLPIALPDCLFEEFGAEDIMEMEFTLSPAGVDNAGWARPADEGHPSSSWISWQVLDCEASGSVETGDFLSLDNGVKVSAMSSVADAIDDSDTSWEEDRYGELPEQMEKSDVTVYGNTYEGPVLLFDGGDEYCVTGGSWTEELEITGFAWGAVYDVATKGKASEKNIAVRLDMAEDHDWGTSGQDGPHYGVLYQAPPVIVQ